MQGLWFRFLEIDLMQETVREKAMVEIGERNYLLRRVLTAIDGRCMGGDVLPIEPPQGGVCHGQHTRRTKPATAIESYYDLRGMDRFGPTDERLRSLELPSAAASCEGRAIPMSSAVGSRYTPHTSASEDHVCASERWPIGALAHRREACHGCQG